MEFWSLEFWGFLTLALFNVLFLVFLVWVAVKVFKSLAAALASWTDRNRAEADRARAEAEARRKLE